ncbi:hypothetical protein EMIT0P218_30230 [Pseudomonas sp. IT-P218]
MHLGRCKAGTFAVSVRLGLTPKPRNKVPMYVNHVAQTSGTFRLTNDDDFSISERLQMP